MPGDIVFQHPQWSLLTETPNACESAWTDSQGLMIGLQHFGPDKPLHDKLADADAVRAHYRNGFSAQGMGLIECEVIDLDGVRAVRAIGKIILEPPRAAYAGTIALPLAKESYVFSVAAEETGITGARDTAIWMQTSMRLESEGYELDLPPDPETGDQTSTAQAPMAWRNAATGATVRWAQDPYDPGFDGPCLRNLADGPEFDAGFPQHPLSRVRFAVQCLMECVRLSNELKDRGDTTRWFKAR